ncbi:hypothetical protein DCC85_03070 [Paenibacillus sp. CAA11]|uniref:YsnF/AvaK domain-containing protein n=1 Tax=Paenibacillus sp. CAA11 TaxID=1532905 RepID=UPI000D3A829D|nr:YsnF/AvaK domain-containing protein [Paenibacillus sp. CAA11]AWB43308.1 hypothetical protein DCC85_03070 [Paenibacillus sp. CAA11]
MNQKIVGVFESENAASRAIEELKNQGFRTEDISVVAKDRRDVKALHEETGTKAPEGVASGAATGGVLGGLAGLLAGIGALAIPGIGPIVAAGPIAATLTGAAVGAGTGGLVGGLVGLGIPEEEARDYDESVNAGRILVLVEADTSRSQDIYGIFRSAGALNTQYYHDDAELAASAKPVVGTEAADQSGKLQLKEEQLDVSKNSIKTGEVELHKEVVEEEKTINVPVTREEVVIERKAVQNRESDAPIGQNETIRIPVREEQVDVNKHTVVTGEVEAHKRKIQETEQVKDSVKREEARVNRTGHPAVSGEEPYTGLDKEQDEKDMSHDTLYQSRNSFIPKK